MYAMLYKCILFIFLVKLLRIDFSTVGMIYRQSKNYSFIFYIYLFVMNLNSLTSPFNSIPYKCTDTQTHLSLQFFFCLFHSYSNIPTHKQSNSAAKVQEMQNTLTIVYFKGTQIELCSQPLYSCQLCCCFCCCR